MTHAEKAQEGIRNAAGSHPWDDDYAEVVQPQKTPTKPVSFHVPGAVVGKMRARIGKVGAHARMFTPEKTVNYEGFVKFCAMQALRKDGGAQMDGPVQVNLLIGVAIPMSWSKKKHAQALSGEIYPTSKPDLDNAVKSIFDAMNGVVYRDDAQVVTTVVKKRYRDAPGAWITVFEIGGEA